MQRLFQLVEQIAFKSSIRGYLLISGSRWNWVGVPGGDFCDHLNLRTARWGGAYNDDTLVVPPLKALERTVSGKGETLEQRKAACDGRLQSFQSFLHHGFGL